MINFFVFNNLSFVWDSFDSLNSVIFDVFFLKRNVLNSAFDGDFLSDGSLM